MKTQKEERQVTTEAEIGVMELQDRELMVTTRS